MPSRVVLMLAMFPTPVGMNRVDQVLGRASGNVPHTRGDEP